MNDLYAILGVKETASLAEIKKVYRKLSKKFHPDVNEGDKYFEERFKEIQNAYEILSDPIRRSKYDSSRKSFGGQSSNHDFFSREEQLKREKEEIRKKEEELRRKEEELKQKENRFKTNEAKDDTRKPFPSRIAVAIVFIIALVLVGNFLRSRLIEKPKWESAPIVDDNNKSKKPWDNDSIVQKPWQRYKALNDSGLRLIDDRGFSTLKKGHWEGTAHQFNINETWGILLSYDEMSKNFIIRYPTLNCTGHWIVTRVTNSLVEFTEYIDEGKSSCNSGGKVVLKRLSETSMEYQYYWPDEITLDAKGQINNKKD